jgi:hypothetical protein
MRPTALIGAVFILASIASAADLKPYQTGKLLQTDSANCTAQSNSSEPSCLQYALESDSVVFHIRPKNAKHAVALPVGERAQFRIDKGVILLHMDGVDNTERPYVVVSISPRTESNTADAGPRRLNHLQ